MSTPALTIAIPFLDEERHLATAIRSILAQSMGHFELLLVDDGSRDRSLDIARSFTDRRVVVISDGKHRGLAARLNEITRRARGELIARMDADDISHPSRIARQLEIIRSSGCDVVGTWAGLVDRAGEPFSVMEAAPLPPSAAVALERGILVHASIVARRSWLLDNPYDDTLPFAEDRDLWCRTAERSRFAVVPEPLYVVRVAPEAERFAHEYAHAQRLNRVLIRRHGPRIVGLAGTARLWLASHAKASAMFLASYAGRAEWLVRRRGRRPTTQERRMLLEAIESAREPSDEVSNLVENDLSR